MTPQTHQIPATISDWLAGWRVSARGNPYRREPNGDTYVLWRQEHAPGGWRARVGRTVIDKRWLDVDSAKAGLWELLGTLSPEELRTMHGPPEDRQPDRQASDREPRREFTGEPPVDDGELLDALPRADGFEALRVSVKEYEGRPYVSLRVWVRDKNTGAMWPTKRGCSVRIRELPRVIAALQKAADLATAGPAAAGAPAGSDRPSARPSWTEALGAARPTRAGFDECAGDEN